MTSLPLALFMILRIFNLFVAGEIFVAGEMFVVNSALISPDGDRGLEERPTFHLKMHWENGYKWDNSSEEKLLCAQCSGQDCSFGAVVLKTCSSNNNYQKWFADENGKIKAKTDPKYCMSFENPDKISTTRCTKANKNNQIVEVKNGGGGRIEIRGNGMCIAPYGYPTDGDILELVKCKDASKSDASYWVTGTFDEDGTSPSKPTAPSPTKPTAPTPTKPSVPTPPRPSGENFQLKMHWQEGYKWYSSEGYSTWMEMSWCATCIKADCSAGAVIVAKCDKELMNQRWQFRNDGKLAPAIYSSKCLSYSDPTRMVLKPCRDKLNPVQKVQMSSSNSKFQLRAAGKCITTGEIPWDYSRLKQVSCTGAVSNTTAYWVRGQYDGHFETNNGLLNENDLCEKKSDRKCPCYPQDDDYYCPDRWYPWKITGQNKVEEDKDYEKCQVSKFEKCKEGEMLCPMRKPRLDRYYGDEKEDVHYFIDYDCIQCVPIEENCSKCSPGVWCEGIGRCVASGKMSKWCRIQFPDRAY